MHSISRTLTQLQLSVFRCGLRRRFATNRKYTETWVVNTYEIRDHNTNKPTKDRFVWIDPSDLYSQLPKEIEYDGIFIPASNDKNEKFEVIAHIKGEASLQDDYVVELTPGFSEYPSWELGYRYNLRRVDSFTTVFTFPERGCWLIHPPRVIEKIEPLISVSQYEPKDLFTDSDWDKFNEHFFAPERAVHTNIYKRMKRLLKNIKKVLGPLEYNEFQADNLIDCVKECGQLIERVKRNPFNPRILRISVHVKITTSRGVKQKWITHISPPLGLKREEELRYLEEYFEDAIVRDGNQNYEEYPGDVVLYNFSGKVVYRQPKEIVIRRPYYKARALHISHIYPVTAFSI